MVKKNKILALTMLFVLIIGTIAGVLSAKAEETSQDGEISFFSVGDNGEEILVCGREETVGDFGDVIGYEITSYDGSGYIPYRDNVHHSMTVTTSDGSLTEGYCMQPYVNGPSITAYQNYNYVEGTSNSTIFASLSHDEIKKWQTVYVVATKYGFGGTMADPNYVTGTNEDDGGTFGTYIINRDGQQKVVRGIMIGGRVYEMTKDEARALTQVIVHYVGNRGSEYTITDFVGNTFPNNTSAAFNHLKAYADSAVKEYEIVGDIQYVSENFDNYQDTAVSQEFFWYVYDHSEGGWVDYNGGMLNKEHVGDDGNIELKVEYQSKNMCNKLVVNSNTDNVTVEYNYDPYLVWWTDTDENHYDYFTVNNSSNVPITVTYDKVYSDTEGLTNEMLDNMEYNIDTFSQKAYIELDAKSLLDNGGSIDLSVETGLGATAANCYDSETDRYGTRMYSCMNIQDCLLLASNRDISASSNLSVNLEMSGKISLEKVSKRNDITSNNSCYSFEGAIYNVYEVDSKSDTSKSKLAGTFVTNSEGIGMITYSKYNLDDVSETTLTKLPLGWYMVCEESGPTNGSYKKDTNRYYEYITMDDYDKLRVVVSEEEPVADPIPFEIVKQCSEGDNVGAASLEGAEFTVWYYKGEYESIEEIEASGANYDRKWVFETRIAESTNNATCIIHEDLLVEGSDEPYLNDKGRMILPLGTIVVEETKAPVGYKLDGAVYNIVNTIDGTKTPIDGPYISIIEEENGTVKLSVSNQIIVSEEPIRGDFKLVKKDKHTGEPMAGIAFSITSKTTGESHVIVTDEDGVASTTAEFVLHSDNTNGNDDYDEKAVLKPTGIWFSGDEIVDKVYDEKGALPYDTYIVKELPCSANREYYLGKEFEIMVTEDGVTCEYGDITNTHKPEIGTEAFDAVDMDKIIPMGGKVSVIDKVNYRYLDTDKTYVLKGVIVNKTTGEVVEYKGAMVDASVEFTPIDAEGIVDMPFEFELVCCKGDKLVVYEYLYDKETGELVASHADINCDKQTLTIESEGVEEETKPTEEITTTEEPTTEVTTTEITTTEVTTEEKVAGEVREEPKTGDSSNIAIVVCVMIAMMVGICLMIMANRKHN